MLESAIQHKICVQLKALGYMTVKCNLMSIPGFPDLIVLGNHGDLFFIECKQKGKKPTRLQEHVHGKLRERGFKVYVLDTTTLPEELTNKTTRS